MIYPQGRDQSLWICSSGSETGGTTDGENGEQQRSTAAQTDQRVEVPATSPARMAAGGEGSSSTGMSAEEIQNRVAEIRSATMQRKEEGGGEEGLVEGVLQEVQLIQWPTVQGALLNTLLVIAIVSGTSLVLFGVNSGLAELSRILYQ